MSNSRKFYSVEVSKDQRSASFSIDLFDLKEECPVESTMTCTFDVDVTDDCDGYICDVTIFDENENEVTLSEDDLAELCYAIEARIDWYHEWMEKQIAYADYLYDSLMDR